MRKLKSILIVVLLCGFTLYLAKDAQAWAIGCGCRKLKKTLKADGVFSDKDAAAVAKCHGGFKVKVCF